MEQEYDYNLEISRIISEIKKSKAKKVMLQLPDGLKPKATELAKEIEGKTSAKVFIWAGSNYGACDIPLAQVAKLKIDLFIHFGHAPFKK